MLDELEKPTDCLSLGIDYIANPHILASQRFNHDMGPETTTWTVDWIKARRSLLYGIGDAQTAVTDKLKRTFHTHLYMGEYLKNHLFGKAEWMIVLSELTDKREKGQKDVREIPQRYAPKALTDSVSQRPTVMKSWTPVERQLGNALPPESYMARLIADAGAEYYL